VSLRFGLS